MKTILALLILASSLSMIGCHKTAAKKLDELLLIVKDLGVGQQGFLRNAGIAETSDSDSNADYSIVDYHPVSGKNRLVLRVISVGDQDLVYFGLDMSGYYQVLKDIKGLNDTEKEAALTDFVMAAKVDKLDIVGVGDDLHFFEQGSGKLFSVATPSNKDLETLGAKIEVRGSEELGEKLVADYGLSEQRAQKVARTINAYQRITSKRSLTEREQNSYSQELLGVDYKKAKNAIMQGENFDQLMEDAAEKNGTSPEQVSAIIRDMIL